MGAGGSTATAGGQRAPGGSTNAWQQLDERGGIGDDELAEYERFAATAAERQQASAGGRAAALAPNPNTGAALAAAPHSGQSQIDADAALARALMEQDVAGPSYSRVCCVLGVSPVRWPHVHVY